MYDDAGTGLLAGRLAPGGVLSVWSAAAVPAYETVLRGHFRSVTCLEVPVPRGEPDVVYVASQPPGAVDTLA